MKQIACQLILACLFFTAPFVLAGGNTETEIAKTKEAAKGLYGTNSHEQLLTSLHAISEQYISDWMHSLIAPEMRGRLAGDKGYDRAAKMAADSLQSWGLKPLTGIDGFFQVFPQAYTLIHSEGSLRLIAQEPHDFSWGKDFYPSGLSGSGKITGQVIYGGYCISAPELGFDEMALLDIGPGSILICEHGHPYQGNDPDTLALWYPHAQTDEKIHLAAQKGAAGMLMTYLTANPRPTVNTDFLYLSIADHVADAFLAFAGYSLAQIRDQRKENHKPIVMPTGVRAEISVDSEYFPEGLTSNVVAVYEGQDPELKNEFLIIGAHLDHLGMMPVLFPGALDNASGVSIALGVARALSLGEIQPGRSMIIVLFGAEEVGLVGSTWFIDHFPLPLENIRAMVNLDMVGRGNGLFAFVAEPWAGLLSHIEFNNERWIHRPLLTRSSPWTYSFRPRTDGAVFQNHRIPTIHFGARGAQSRSLYHVPEDDMRQIELPIMRDVIRILTMTMIQLSHETDLPEVSF